MAGRPFGGVLGPQQVFSFGAPTAARVRLVAEKGIGYIRRWLRGDVLVRLRIRKANIRPDLRERFSLYGKDVVALALGLGTLQGMGGHGTAPVRPTDALLVVHTNQTAAAEWLREERDREDRHTDLMSIIEFLILLFVVIGVGLDFAILLKGSP